MPEECGLEVSEGRKARSATGCAAAGCCWLQWEEL